MPTRNQVHLLTAHKRLGPTPGTYEAGWDIYDESGYVMTVPTKAQAQHIVKTQRLPDA